MLLQAFWTKKQVSTSLIPHSLSVVVVVAAAVVVAVVVVVAAAAVVVAVVAAAVVVALLEVTLGKSYRESCGDEMFEILFWLFFSFADVNLSDSFGRSALHNAVLKGAPTIVEMLLNANADVNIKDDREDSPVHYVARTGNPQILKVITTSSTTKNIHGNSVVVALLQKQCRG